MCEEWKPVDGYVGYYEVSNYGNVVSVERDIINRNGISKHRKCHVMSQQTNEDGYKTVKLSKDGKSIRIGVHILVARAFVDGYFQGAEVNHKDCNRANNICTNLEWCTHVENIDYCLQLGRHVSQILDFSGSNNPNYGNTKLKEKYFSNRLLSTEKQGRSGSRNGKSKKILLSFDNGDPICFDYIGECANYIISKGISRTSNVNAVRTAISKSIKEKRKYFGLELSFI